MISRNALSERQRTRTRTAQIIHADHRPRSSNLNSSVNEDAVKGLKEHCPKVVLGPLQLRGAATCHFVMHTPIHSFIVLTSHRLLLMFGIPELDDMICRHLSPHDLTQCAQVNRKWHTAVMPQLWRDLSWIGHTSVSQQQAFLKLILEDYLQEQHRRKLQLKGGNMDQSVQAQSSTLAKYHYWIRVLPQLPAPAYLDRWLVANSIRNNPPQRQHLVSKGNRPTTRELALHLFKQCNTADVARYSLDYRTIQSDPAEKAIAEHVLPRVHHLSVMATYLRGLRELAKLKQLLSLCSTKLETLALNVSLSTYRDYEKSFNGDDDDEVQQPHKPTDWTSFKNLVLCRVWYDGSPAIHCVLVLDLRAMQMG
ncbi:hypothetical protein B0O80DRAFT_85564 [Mortierella sp. GBAus27b]|nr:hypothetical protein B0O80DRAFT_85564 [Mortierella sp. GBAus27b]